MIRGLMEYGFLQNAFLAAVLSSIVCGIIGTIVVEKKIVSLSGGIAHASFGGIGLGYLLEFEPIIGALFFAVGSSIGINVITRRTDANDDTLIGMFWSVGMALGIFFISLTPGYLPDMNSYLFGDILTVSRFYIAVMGGLTGIIIICVSVYYNYWKAYLFDEEFLKAMSVNVAFLQYFLYILISLSIIILIKVVGIILSIALLTIPASTAKQLTKNFKNIMIFSTIIGTGVCISGLTVSYYFNIPSGATIIIIGMVVYLAVLCCKKLFTRNI